MLLVVNFLGRFHSLRSLQFSSHLFWYQLSFDLGQFLNLNWLLLNRLRLNHRIISHLFVHEVLLLFGWASNIWHEFHFLLLHWVIHVKLTLQQVIFWMFFARIKNQIILLLWIFICNLLLCFGWLWFWSFRRFVKELNENLHKIENFITCFHVDICEEYFSFSNDTVFLRFHFIDELLPLNDNIFLFFGLINE